MSQIKRLSERNALIAEMLSDGKQLKNFYRFVAQNPHIDLHDACQIIIARPSASVCFTFEEWNAMGRRVTKGRKGIPYYDRDGNKQFVFDANDTHGEKRYQRPILPMKRLLEGLDAINDTSLADSNNGDYRKIHTGVSEYLKESGNLSGDIERNRQIIAGIAYSLYCRTGFPSGSGVELHGLPYSLTENAALFKEIYELSEDIAQEVEEAYIRKQEEVEVIDDTEEESLSDEPVMPSSETRTVETIEPDEQKNIVVIHSAVHSHYRGYVALVRYKDPTIPNGREEIFLGKSENYDNCGHYDNTDNSLVFVSENPKMYYFLYGNGWTKSQDEMLKGGYFTLDDYKEYAALRKGILSNFEQIGEPRFGIKYDVPDSGVPFVDPDEIQPKHLITPLNEKYLSEQQKYPDAVVLMRLGDFFEVMGENAVTVAGELDLVLTGREVGLPERVPMCGFPYHAADRYIEKILEKHSVLVVEDGEQPKYILSHAEAREQSAATEQPDAYSERETDTEEAEFPDDKPDPFDEDIAELTDDDIYGSDESDEPEEVAEAQPQEKRKGKPLSQRKRKEKPRPSLFDFLDGRTETEQTPLEKLIEWGLKYGSMTENGKFRIYDNYKTDPTVKEFAAFLKNEYGWGGHSGGGEMLQSDGKGLVLAKRDDAHPENNAVARLSWEQVANGIADLIDDGNYFTAEQQRQYDLLQQARAERSSASNDAKKLRVIARQFIDKETARTRTAESVFEPYMCEESAEFVKAHRSELERALLAEKEIKSILPIPEGYEYLYKDNIYVEFYPQYCPRLEDDEKSSEEVTEAANQADENTDLTAVGFDQSELGGAKQRYRNNIAAIRLTNTLYDEDRNPYPEEKKVLAKYVGWGGIAQVFDEHNTQWTKEYAELKTSLSHADYERAKGSVLNAHYTSKEVIEGIYKALARLGVKGNNRILEPAMGTGNFFGYMPKEISDGASLYGVELDNITGRIAAKLYPQVRVQVKGYEETTFPNDHFDLVVTNVPFGGYGVADSEYNRHKFLIHDYFIAKSIDKVCAGGIVAVITSKGTMDKLNPSVRKYLADRAELLGAIRLPNTAFKQTANTEVVTDILFFQKREEQINADTQNTEWLSTEKTAEGYEINNYFIRHPEMVLGNLAEEHGLYGAIDVTVKPDGRQLSDALSEAIGHLPESVYSNPTEPQTEQEETAVDYDVRPFNYKAVSGRLYMRIGESMVEQEIPKSPKDAYERIKGMIALRTQLRHILDIQTDGCSDGRLADEQRMLNANYDRFVRKYGYLNSQTNTRLFRDDGDSALLFACEELSEDKSTATKADVFTKRTIRPYAAPTSTDDCFEALQISRNERGGVDISYIEELTKKDYDTVLSELGDAVFRNPVEVDPENKYSGFETAEEYLSGKVVQKLGIAKSFAAQFPNSGYERNVTALEKVQPEPLTAADITVRLGASWVDKEYYKEFLMRMLGIPYYYRDGLELYYNPHDSSWRVDKADYVRNTVKMKATEVYGTSRANAFRLFEDCMNLRATNIYDTVEEDGHEKRVLNQAETIAAREKQNKIKEAFKDWIFNDPKRREELEETYNRLFNQIRLPSYDGSYLHFPEMNPAVELRPHQKNAVHRIITSGNTLLHHVVGSGKTYTIAATVMKLRQYGLAKKPMIAVPNHLVEQWAGEFRTLYPNAKLLIATKDDLAKENRQRFVGKVAMGDWDAVIIAQSSFAKIPISPERQIDKVHEEIAKIDATIEKQWEESGFPRGAVKNLERIKKNKETQLKRLLDDKNKDSLLSFESLGVDYLFVDEAHFYKNKFLFTKMNNVAGISTTASQRAADLELKAEYINELHGGDKGVVFATGTPISNSMTEMYTMQSYLQKRTLEEIGLNFFDGWAADFGETVTSLELAPSGQGYKPRTRFAKFTNLPELQTLYRSFADVQTADMVKLAVPEAERTVVNLHPSETVIELAEGIAERAERIYGGGVDPRIDNMLKVTSDGKKLALDARCFDPMAGDEPISKLNACAGRIFEIWEDTKDRKSTQIVFCDMSTPKHSFSEYEYGKDFDVYNDLKHKLTERGIPANEIAFIHDASTDGQKQDLFKKVNAGQIRVLIGSTEKCGAGTNAQQRLIALHHLDTPYRPSDMEQREGRIIRQGNTNEKVQIYTYVTERTFDSYSYQILENKQRFISQICKGDMTAREADDVDETTLSYAEIKAITAANPRIKRKMEVDGEVAKLRVLEGQHKKSLYCLQDKVNKTLPEQIRKQALFIERLKEDRERLKEHFNPDVFSISVNGVTFTDKKDGARALTDALYASKPDTVVAEYGGFKISMDPPVMLTSGRTVTVAGSGQYVLEIGQSASGNITRLDNFFADFPNKEARASEKLKQLKNDLETAKSQLTVPFEHKERLTELLKEQAELNAELDLNRREEVVIDDGDNNGGDELYAALPEQGERAPARKKHRKPLDKYSMSVYDKQKAETPEAYIFVKNGNRYELFGDQAERYAAQHELPVITDTLDGVQILVLSLEDVKLDKTVAELVESGYMVKIIETLENKKEDELIDKIDNVAAMEVALVPDTTVNQESMHRYGYTWDGMLPLNRRTAERLWSMGLQIYALHPDDTETEITDFDQFGNNGIYGIEKPVWNNYLSNKETDAYFAARMYVANAAGKVINKELDYVDARYADPLSDINFDERAALKKYMRGKELPDVEKIKPYLPELLTEYSDLINLIPLEYYGWDIECVKRSIANNIEHDEMKTYANELTKIRFDIDSEYDKMLSKMSEDEIQSLNLPAVNNVLTVVAKEKAFLIQESKSISSWIDGSLLLHDEIADKWYVINNTYIMDENEKYLEVGDKTTVKNFLVYTGLEKGNPLYEFADEISAWEYYISQTKAVKQLHLKKEKKQSSDGVKKELDKQKHEENIEKDINHMTENNALTEVMDYTALVRDSVNREFDTFEVELLKKPVAEVINNNHRIYVFTELRDVINEDDYLSASDYRALYEDNGHILQSLFDDFISDEYASVNNYGDTAEFIKSYNEDRHGDILQAEKAKEYENEIIRYFGEDRTNVEELEEPLRSEELGRSRIYYSVTNENGKYLLLGDWYYNRPTMNITDSNIEKLSELFENRKESYHSNTEFVKVPYNDLEKLTFTPSYPIYPDSVNKDEVSDLRCENLGVEYVSSVIAETLFDLGVWLYALDEGGTGKAVHSVDGIKQHNGLFGVKKSEWDEFLKSERSTAFLCASFAVIKASEKVISDYQHQPTEMLEDETFGINKYLAGRVLPDLQEIAKYIPALERRYAITLEMDDSLGIDEIITAIDERLQDVIKPYLDPDSAPETEPYVLNATQAEFLFGLTQKPSNEEAVAIVSERVLKEYDNYMKNDGFVVDEEKFRMYTDLKNILTTPDANIMINGGYTALYEDGDLVLSKLYDYYQEQTAAGNERVADAVSLIDEYNLRFHEDIIDRQKIRNISESMYYYGKDKSGAAYYVLYENLNRDVLAFIKGSAESYVIAANANYLSADLLKENDITFLKTEREIEEEVLLDGSDIFNTMREAANVIRTSQKTPVYLRSREYAKQHDEQELYESSRIASEKCLKAIDKAISENYDDNTLGKGFEDEIVEKFGYDRVAYVLGTIIQTHNYDGRYSRENRAWAENIPISESEDVRRFIYSDEHPGLVDLFARRIRLMEKQTKNEEEQTLQENKYLNETAQGHKVISMAKDKFGRNTAIIQRPKDYVVGVGYDTREGRWAQGYYNFATLEAAQQFRVEKYNANGVDNPRITVSVAREALIQTYNYHSFMRMPETSKYAGYTYNVWNNRIKESNQSADLQGDSGDPCYVLSLAEDETVTLNKPDTEAVELTASEFYEQVNGTTSKDYLREKASKTWFSLNVPQDALIGIYDKSTLLKMPNRSGYAGFSYYIPNAMIEEDKDSEEGLITISLPADFTVTVKDRDGNTESLTAAQFHDRCRDSEPADYVMPRAKEGSGAEAAAADKPDSEGWHYVSVDKAAIIAEYENRTLLKMPNGEYAGFTYYLPNALIKENEEKGTIRLSIPDDLIITVKNGKSGDAENLSAEAFIGQLKGKTPDDYTQYRKPSEEQVRELAQREALLRKHVPKEMLARNNWVAVRTRENADKGRLDKFLIDCHTGKFAESDNPETWTDFDSACKYAKENGCVTLAYALDGKDGIACIDLDDCFEKNGDFGALASEVFSACDGTYCEKSVSGKGLHFFGKTNGMDLRTFSKNGDLEFYQRTHFIAMTGDDYGSTELKSFDAPEMKRILESKCAKRTEPRGVGKGTEGLSSMSDRDVVDKACAAKHGDTFKALYNGQNLQNNHSNSDMSLMNRLAFWCNGDKEQMLRIFATSGLYRENKPQAYYECTAIKAVRDMTERYKPQTQTATKPVKAGGDKGGK